MNKKEAAKLISEKTAQAMALIREAEKLADESGQDFSFKVAYGMGGRYWPTTNDEDDENTGWQSSSRNC